MASGNVGSAVLATGPVRAGGPVSQRVGGGERRPHGPPGTSRPRRHQGGVRGYFFPARFTASRKVSFWKPRLPARHAAGSTPARGPPARPGLRCTGWVWRGQGSPGTLWHGGMCHPCRCVSGSQGCGWDAAVPPAHAMLPRSASPRRKEQSCLKPHPVTHPRGIPVGLAGERGPA